MKNTIRIDDVTYTRLKKKIGKNNDFGRSLLEVAHNLPGNLEPQQLIPAMAFLSIALLRRGGMSKKEILDWMSDGYDIIDSNMNDIVSLMESFGREE